MTTTIEPEGKAEQSAFEGRLQVASKEHEWRELVGELITNGGGASLVVCRQALTY